MSDVDRIKQRIEKEQKFDEDLWNTEANQASQIDKAIHDARKFLYRTIFSIIDEELTKEPQEEPNIPIQCVDGSCPMALAEEYAERGMDVVHSCTECHYHDKEPQEESVCKHMCGKIHKNEVGEDIVFCELCDCDKNITLGDCLNNCDSQDNISEPQECNSDLISRKKLIEDLREKRIDNISLNGETIVDIINNQPQVQPIVRTTEEVVEMLNKISCPDCDKNSSHCHFSETDCNNYWHDWLTKKEV